MFKEEFASLESEMKKRKKQRGSNLPVHARRKSWLKEQRIGFLSLAKLTSQRGCK